MPEQYRAESARRLPSPTGDALDSALNALADVADNLDEDNGTSFIGGFEGGLLLAIEHPDEARQILAHIDRTKTESPVGSEAATIENAGHRRYVTDGLANIVNGTLKVLPLANPNPEPADDLFRWN